MPKNSGVTIHIPTPESDKALAVKKESQAIGTFLEWYRAQHPAIRRKSIEIVLAEYFQIDLDKVEKEKRAILNGIRAANEAREA
jgi:hypothetical protein